MTTLLLIFAFLALLNPAPAPLVLGTTAEDDAPWTTEEAMAAIRLDPMMHFKTCAKIKMKDGRVRAPDQPNTLQVRLFRAYAWLQARGLPINLILLKPRQSGGSEGTAELCYHHSRRFNLSGFMMADIHDRTDKIWTLFTQKKDPGMDEYAPFWGNQFKANTEQARIIFKDENGMKCEAVWDRGTANDSKAGASGTRQIIWLSESARYAKEGAFRDSQVIGNALNSIPPDLANTMRIAESTAEGCYDDQTELLTDEGWKFFSALRGDERILTRSLETGVAYYQPEWRKIEHEWNGDLVTLDARSVNLRVTPDHAMWVARQKGIFRFSLAQTMVGPVTDYQFQRALTWEAPGVSTFTLPAYTHRQGNGYRTRPAVSIPIKAWLRFLGHWLADGNACIANRSVSLTQAKFIDAFRESAADLAAALKCSMRETVHRSYLPNRSPARRFIIENMQLVSYLAAHSQPKRIPRELLMTLSREQCRMLLRAIYEGDGCQEHIGRASAEMEYGRIFVGIDKTLQDDIQELALKAGYATSAYGHDRNRVVTYTEQSTATLRHDNPPRLERYLGKVHCVALPKDHLLMVRRGGTAIWCGNTGGWHYETFEGAVTLEERQAGRVGNGWIKIFVGWHECDDYTLPDLPQNAEFFDDNKADWTPYREDEEASRIRYGWTREQIAWRRKKIVSDLGGDTKLFKRDYPASPEEAWSSSGAKKFNVIAVARMLKEAEHLWHRTLRGDPMAPKMGSLNEGAAGAVNWLPAREDAWLWVLEPPKYGCCYSLVVDPMTGEQASGSDKPDNHAPLMIRKAYADEKGVMHRAEVVAAVYQPNGCRWDMDVLADRIALLSRWYGRCIVVNEVNKAMDLVPLLQQRHVTLYRRRARPDIVNPSERQMIVGFYTDTSTRQMWVTAAAEAIRESTVGCLFLPAVKEFDTFIVNSKGKAEAAPGAHDDFVAAFGIGVLTIESATRMALPVIRQMHQPQQHRHFGARGSGALS